MSTTESILFLLDREIGHGEPDDGLVQSDPEPVLADVRDSEPPPSSSVGPASSRGSQPPPSVRGSQPPGAPQSSRSRGPYVPTVFDVVEFGAPTVAPIGGRMLEDGEEGRSSRMTIPPAPPNTMGMREAIGAITVDDRDGPASNRIAVQERIQNRQRMRELASTLVRYRSIGIVNSQYHEPVQVRAAEFHRTANCMCWELSSPWIDPPFVIEVAGYNSVFQIPVEAASMRDGLMLTPLPREIVRLRRRWGRRAHAPEGTIAVIRIEGSEGLEAHPVRDVSFNGLSFWCDSGDQRIRAGVTLDLIEVAPPGEPMMRFAGEVSFVAVEPNNQMDLCGVRLRPLDNEHVARWRAMVSRALYPSTRMGAGWADAVWRLYDRAGYFNLSGKDAHKFLALESRFLDNASHVARSPEMGCLVVWPLLGTREVFATISMLKIYQSAWFVYQLAKVTGDAPDGASSRQVLRDVHLMAYEHAQLDPALRYVIAYPQVKPIWSRAVHHDLPRRYTTAGLACVVRFRALEVACDVPRPPVPADLEIGPARPDEIEALLARLAQTHPRAYFEAYDLTLERLDLAENKRLWASVGLRRERVIHVARRGGRAIAAALLEDAEEGLHLFRLLDVVRPFPMVSKLTEAAPAMDALISDASRWYRERGKPSFCCFVENDDWLTPPMMATVEDMGLADMTILAAQLLPELLEHLIEVTAPREGR